MNTTMADGAHDRLDAQIAEALFGQPGMSKMDVANRVRELRGDGPALLVGGRRFNQVSQVVERFGMAVTPEEMGAAIANAPSSRFSTESAAAAFANVQPSPGGQGVGVSISDDDRAVLQRLQDALPTAGINGWAKGVDVLERLLRDSLAARQPEGATVKDSLTVAARQPVESNLVIKPRRDVADEIRGLQASVAIGSDKEWVSIPRHVRDSAIAALHNVSSDFAHVYAAYIAKCDARQPVGEPVAYIEHFADKVSRVEMTMTGLHLGIGRHPVYAAPQGSSE